MKKAYALILFLLLAAQITSATNLYRYKNAQGKTEISHTIPNERVVYGYDVIDQESGNLLERVAPQLSPAEVILKERRELREAQCKAALARVYNRYESEAEISAAEQQFIDSVESRMGNAKANIAQLQTRRLGLEEQAARIERAGNMITPVLLNNLDSTDAQIKKLQLEIRQRIREQQISRDQFSLDLALFRKPSCATLWKHVEGNR